MPSPSGDDNRLASLVLFSSAETRTEVGIRHWPVGRTLFAIQTHCLCYFMQGQARCRSANGEEIDVAHGTLVHFKSGWNGALEVFETLDASYMQCTGGPAEETRVLRDVLHAAPLKDWGPIPTMLKGTSRTGGLLLSRDPDGSCESGIWTCTPGTWRCIVTRDEYCHFLAGSCTYTHDNGEQIEIRPDTLAFFPAGWSGQCEVTDTLRKVYMIR